MTIEVRSTVKLKYWQHVSLYTNNISLLISIDKNLQNAKNAMSYFVAEMDENTRIIYCTSQKKILKRSLKRNWILNLRPSISVLISRYQKKTIARKYRWDSWGLNFCHMTTRDSRREWWKHLFGTKSIDQMDLTSTYRNAFWFNVILYKKKSITFLFTLILFLLFIYNSYGQPFFYF